MISNVTFPFTFLVSLMQCDSVSLNVSRDHRSRKATNFFFFGVEEGGGQRI